jgi:hypothetical protein
MNETNASTHARTTSAAEANVRVRADARDVATARRIGARSRRYADIHNDIHKLFLYPSTARSAYGDRMGFEVHFEDETTTQVLDADAYEQEGPLTTFFDRNGGGGLTSAFALRVASFRTSRIVEIRAVPFAAAARLVS